MTPADILAAARSNPLSAIVPTREEWLNGYEGSLRYMGEHGPIAAWRIGGGDDHHHVVFIRGLSVDAVTCGAERLRFDLRRREVRHRLVDCGAPEWCRESVAGMLGWVVSRKASGLGRSWVHVPVDSLWTWRRPEPGRAGTIVSIGDHGWSVFHLRGPETGPEARSCADLAALHAGCVLEEADGWYIPLPDDGVGWLPRKAA